MSRGLDERRDRPARAINERPRWLTPAEQERFKDLGTARFKDTEFQRYAQSFRAHASLSAAGKLGFATTTERHESEFAWDRAADKGRAHLDRISRDEKQVMALLGDLGHDYRNHYTREHKVAPRTHVDFAWPLPLKRCIEVYGGVHFGPLFDRDGLRAAADARKITRVQDAGWQVLVLTSNDLTRQNWPATPERVAAWRCHINVYWDRCSRPTPHLRLVCAQFPAAGHASQARNEA